MKIKFVELRRSRQYADNSWNACFERSLKIAYHMLQVILLIILNDIYSYLLYLLPTYMVTGHKSGPVFCFVH